MKGSNRKGSNRKGNVRPASIGVVAAVVAACVMVGGAVGAQEVVEPGVPVLPAGQGGAECDPETGDVVWELTWTNTYDVEMTIVVDYYRLSNEDGSAEVDLAPWFPTSLAPGETVVMGPERIPGDRGWSIDFHLEVFTELSEDPVGGGSTDILYGACPQPEMPQPGPEPVPATPRFTG